MNGKGHRENTPELNHFTYRIITHNDENHLFLAPLQLPAQLLHHLPSSLSFSAKVFLCLFNISSLGYNQSTQQKRQKLGLQMLENAVVMGKLFTQIAFTKRGGGRDDISIDTRIPFTTQVSREHLLLQ